MSTAPAPIELSLAHSPDPDDAFMWWPITGKINPDASPLDGPQGRPAINTGRWCFRAVPADIEILNRRAASPAERPQYDITALSVRCWADVRDRYAITTCGASFGDGFGPKVVAKPPSTSGPAIRCEGCLRPASINIAIPGRRTTAFLMLSMILGRESASASPDRFVEMPFDQIIGAVARGEHQGRPIHAGLVIHEGQLTFGDAGLRLVIDVGEWWKEETGLLLPLGVNAVRRDLDARFGPGSLREVCDLLRASVAYSMDRREESTRYTLPFAMANVARGGGEAPTMERLDRYCRMYVSEETRDMGERGRQAIERLLSEGAKAGACPDVGRVDLV
ncbi:MAG: ABC transporter substrate-binding protein [Phycisphaerales bacterium]|nr:ABC transporter substrate-binding protein [Phycisphaerales bacterium]